MAAVFIFLLVVLVCAILCFCYLKKHRGSLTITKSRKPTAQTSNAISSRKPTAQTSNAISITSPEETDDCAPIPIYAVIPGDSSEGCLTSTLKSVQGDRCDDDIVNASKSLHTADRQTCDANLLETRISTEMFHLQRVYSDIDMTDHQTVTSCADEGSTYSSLNYNLSSQPAEREKVPAKLNPVEP